MSEPDLEKLLGGFAADTLMPEEKQSLYSAALQDQQLFNALTDEQALKELLADPVVRRRLLQTLKQTSISGVGGSLSWLEWFRRPAGLAIAGGLAAAALAVVLGVRIYQDSLRQAAQSVAIEESKPAPQAVEPQAKSKESVAPVTDLPKKDTLIDKLAKRERSAPPPLKNARASDVVRDSLNQRSKQDEVRREAEAPGAALGKLAEEVALSSDQKLAASSAPSAAAPELKQTPVPASTPVAGAVAQAVSARAFFYGGEATRPDGRSMAQEKERAMKPLAESAPQSGRLERRMDQFAFTGKSGGTATQLRPLGLRYSFVVRGTDGQEREVDTATAKSTEPVRLTVEANQDAYLQVWKAVGSSTPQLLWPENGTGQISLRIAKGQRQSIPLPTDSGRVTLTARLSRVPFSPITRQEAAMSDRLSPNQLQESFASSSPTGSQEQAAYVVNQDLSTAAQIVVDIILGQ